MKKRLLILSEEISGMNKYLFESLKNLGWEITVEDIPTSPIFRWLALIVSFHPQMSRWKKRFEVNFIKFYKTEWMFKEKTRRAQAIVEKHKNQFDVIFQISSMFAPSSELFSAGHKKSPDKKYVLMLDYTTSLSKDYSGFAPFGSELKRRLFLERVVYTNAEFIFTTSENTKRSLIEHYGVEPQRIVTAGYGLNLKEVKKFEKEYDGKTLLFIGIDFERKGGFVLLDAFKLIKKEIPDAKLIIIGPNKDIYKISEPDVEFLGSIKDRQTIENFYQEASVFVMPSLCEPFGLVFLEAMAYKLPCIGTDRDAMPEFIHNGKNGFIVPPGDSQALAKTMIDLLKDKARLKQLGEYAQSYVKENFLWEKVAGRMDNSLRNLIS